MSTPAQYIRAAFGVTSTDLVALPHTSLRVWRCGDVVLRQVYDPAEAAWVAETFESLRVTGIRIPRPVRSLDGRWVVAGWRAERFVAGRPAGNFDELLRGAMALHAALATVSQPRFLDMAPAPFLRSIDDQTWHHPDQVIERLADTAGGEAFVDIFELLQPVTADSQLIHGNIFGKVLFAGSAPPAVIDFSPLWRPATYGAALPIVDAIAWGGAPESLAEDWSHLDYWPGMLGRAILARIALAWLHPRSTSVAKEGILRVASELRAAVAGGQAVAD